MTTTDDYVYSNDSGYFEEEARIRYYSKTFNKRVKEANQMKKHEKEEHEKSAERLLGLMSERKKKTSSKEGGKKPITFDEIENEKLDIMAINLNEFCKGNFDNGKIINVALMTNPLNNKIEYFADRLTQLNRAIRVTNVFYAYDYSKNNVLLKMIPKHIYQMTIIMDLLETAPAMLQAANTLYFSTVPLYSGSRSASLVFARNREGVKRLSMEKGYPLTSNGYKTDALLSFVMKNDNVGPGLPNESVDFFLKGIEDHELNDLMKLARVTELSGGSWLRSFQRSLKEIDPNHMVKLYK